MNQAIQVVRLTNTHTRTHSTNTYGTVYVQSSTTNPASAVNAVTFMELKFYRTWPWCNMNTKKLC